MNIDHRNPRLRRGFAFVALAAVLGLSAVGLTQCRMVDNSVTGVDVRSNSGFHGSSSGRSKCVQQCNEAFKKCIKDEEARYKAAKKACKAIANSADRKACEKNEARIHSDNKKACVRQKELCKKNRKYREGAGSAGR